MHPSQTCPYHSASQSGPQMIEAKNVGKHKAYFFKIYINIVIHLCTKLFISKKNFSQLIRENSFESTSRQLLQSYPERLSRPQIPPRLAYPWTFWTVAHSQFKIIKYFFFTDLFTYSRTQSALSFPTPLSIANLVFQNNLHLSSPNASYKRALLIPGWPSRLSAPSNSAAGDLDGTSQDLVLFLASVGL